jgi:hypothetical protein
MRRWGFGEDCAVLLYDDGQQQLLRKNDIYGAVTTSLKQVIRSADVLWNLYCSIRPPLLNEFKRKALLDGDPGQLQISALDWDLNISEHDVLFSVGLKINDRDCQIPTLGKNWQPVFPVVYIPFWRVTAARTEAPITSVTQWNWGDDFALNGRTLSNSKRDAYLRFVNLPRRCSQNFMLAANIHPDDKTGDRELLLKSGWRLVHPHQCIRTVAQYQHFISNSLAELSCAKSVYTALRTGWFSERSAAYLATGRPVIAEDTGFAEHLPTGRGLLCFTNLDEAAASVDDLLVNYMRHQVAARQIAEVYLSTEVVLPRMIELSCK